ncbi:MAG TPA: DUF4245 domain-containing protein [Nocardioidaceae bacterium]|nr:DUF4245 domain-containing protein [Nocardioidaceae bacterium]
MSQQSGRYQRSAGGMVGALVVLLGVIAAFVAFRAVNRDNPQDPVDPVDYRPTVEFARGRASFPLLAPAALPDGWVATSAGFTPPPREHWHLGLLTAQERYVGLEQDPDASVRSMLEEFVDPQPRRAGDATIAGVRWQVWRDDGGDTALVRHGRQVTTLVVGTAPRAVLVDFAGSLR